MQDFEKRAGDVYIILDKAYQVLANEHIQQVSIAYLEAVATVKFGLQVIVHLLHSQCYGSESSSESVFDLLHLVQKICLDPVIHVTDTSYEKDVMGPAIYLVKLLVREFGSASLVKISSIHKWIIPDSLKSSHQVGLMKY